MKIGCHVSIRSGFAGAARAAWEMGASSFQYFPKNPRSLAVKAFDHRDAAACKQFCEKNGIVSIAHTPYPTNLSVDDPDLYQATVRSVINDLEIANACGSIGLVVHFGQYKGKVEDPLFGYKQMIRMVNDILGQWTGAALLLIENNAGQGNSMGMTIEELVQIRQLLAQPERVGYCLDTCHAFASGMWNGTDWQPVARKARELGFLKHVKAIHLNDSMHPTGSRRDRHANIGKGHIPEAAFQEVFETPEFRELPCVLETPHPAGESHQKEIAWVKERFIANTKASL
ncbi:deoxyribonuclease IV [Brevibacillus migulae]|uniref:deoxyribonuclease IV n=1 Tax=Brevibacillus migulae TaxID=1644114 RepID=UPI00106E51DE|nr:deoxyribonuclease IV [Brevibacillus migulae]